MYWSPNPQGDGTWKEDLGEVMRFRRSHEHGALWMGLVSLQKVEETRALSHCHVNTQGEGGLPQAWKMALTGKGICQHLDLGLVPSGTVRHICW